MNDILPEDSGTWRYLESVVREIVQSYGYSEIRLPLLEYTEPTSSKKRCTRFSIATAKASHCDPKRRPA
jgi:histidyl-tRNA synthetase